MTVVERLTRLYAALATCGKSYDAEAVAMQSPNCNGLKCWKGRCGVLLMQ